MWIKGFLVTTDETKNKGSSLITRGNKYSTTQIYSLLLISLSAFQNISKHIYSTFGRPKVHLSFLYAQRLSVCLYEL